MPDVRLIRRVRHSPDNLMTLVKDVEEYPKFIYLLSAIRVKKRDNAGADKEQFLAEATVAYKFVRETFECIVDVDGPQHAISVKKSDRGGAVKALSNTWKFYELSDGSTLIDFFVSVKLKAFPLEILLREKFDETGQEIMKLFEDRAEELFDRVGNNNIVMAEEYSRLGIDRRLV